jgi:hypothetical protein
VTALTQLLLDTPPSIWKDGTMGSNPKVAQKPKSEESPTPSSMGQGQTFVGHKGWETHVILQLTVGGNIMKKARKPKKVKDIDFLLSLLKSLYPGQS